MTEESKETRYDAAIALKEAGDSEHAMEQLEKLCEDFPDYALPHAALSMLYCRFGAFEDSLKHATRVCELEPQDPFSFTALSSLAIKSGNHELAEAALSKARNIQAEYFNSENADKSESADKTED